ncbi:DUF2637 domain-containing protein [Streptomyces sp. H39-S7]|uniref:DUF2637 domain-containing protein n=1 Tax=Streptomyces sp. H39-S7 TaxID=3004357 RepID=UPI0022AEB8AD|nr:DUF2637 domain-containing protein [Streptomyces sp. H39-S7]MCZ4117908.1 DUF2637 domain-containing protein [Streptomyces sp. H39-S7]
MPAFLATAIRTGVALLALAAFALSYDALRQMAAASHIHHLLTYAFPLVIDGFIAIGIGALLVLRAAPLRSRLYVAGLVGIATLTSIWANVLHAVRVNQQTSHTGLALDNITVGVISAIAPLALAGAVHFYLLVARHPEPHESARHITADATPEGRSPAATQEPTCGFNETQDDEADQVAELQKPAAERRGRLPSATLEQAVEIGRTAAPGRSGRISRRHIEKAIRDKGLAVGRERLDRAKDILQSELDQTAKPLGTG